MPTALLTAAGLLTGCPEPTVRDGVVLHDLTPAAISFEEYLTLDTTRANAAELALRTNLEPFAIRQLEATCGRRARRLRTYFSTIQYAYEPESDGADVQLLSSLDGRRSVELPGVYAPYGRDRAEVAAVERLQADTLLRRKQYFAFLCDAEERGRRGIALIRAESPYQALRLLQTNPTGGTEPLISALQQLDRDYGLQVLGADINWCLVRLRRVPAQPRQLAEQLQRICPYLAGQDETGAARLAAQLQTDPYIEFGWD
jgi:hypothetical protein